MCYLVYYKGIRMTGLRKTTRNLLQCNRISAVPKYEAGPLSAGQRVWSNEVTGL
jgi:hypothetical protein